MNEHKQHINEVRALGLSEKAAQIYVTLLELGGAYPSKIAEVTKLNRSTVYALLTDLAIKGLVSEVEKRKKLYYQIEHPKKLVQFSKMQIHLAEERLEKAKKILPEFEGLFSNIPHKPVVRFFEGFEGVLSVYEDHLMVEQGYEMVGMSNVGELLKFAPRSFIEKYVKEKERLGITARGIFPDTEADTNYNETVYKKVHKKYWPELRFIPSELFPFKSEIVMYGKNKISMINFHENHPVGIIIEDDVSFQAMKLMFELAWRGASK